MLVYQINPMTIELFAYVNTFLWSNGSEKALLKIDIASGPLPNSNSPHVVFFY